MVTGRARRCSRGKSTWTLSHLGLETGEAVGNGLESFPHGVEMIEAFLQAEVAQIVGAEFVAQEAGELLILFEKGVLPVGAENVMAVLDLVDDGGQFAAQSLVAAGRRRSR